MCLGGWCTEDPYGLQPSNTSLWADHNVHIVRNSSVVDFDRPLDSGANIPYRRVCAYAGRNTMDGAQKTMVQR